MGGVDSGRTVSQAGERRSARIESLRALAALSVLAGHVIVVSSAAGHVSDNLAYKVLFGGGLGVFFFFGLTGYLLFWPFAQRYFGDGDVVDLGRYALNRAVRILPLYYAVVITVLAFAHVSGGVWGRFLTFTETTSSLTAGNFVGPAWSLVVEITFYALLPLLAWAIAKLARGSIARGLAIILLLGAASLACRILTVYIPDPADPLWRFNLPATFVFFVPGMTLALLRVRWEERRLDLTDRSWGSAQLWFAASLVVWIPVVLISYKLDFLICAASFLAIAACTLPLRDGPLVQALDWRPLVAVGVASYSLYLWHLPVIESLEDLFSTTPGPAALALVGVPVSIAVALLSYRAIESPFLKLRRQWSRSSAAQEDEAEVPEAPGASLKPSAPA